MSDGDEMQQLRPEVAEAVNDILHGCTTDSHTEWLQRMYAKLMDREAQMVSKYAAVQRKGRGNGPRNGQRNPNRPNPQHVPPANGANPYENALDGDRDAH